MLYMLDRHASLQHLGSDRLQILMEQWISCNGIWKESTLCLRMSQKSSYKKRGCRAWLTYEQIVAKYGSESVAKQIVDSKWAISDKDARDRQIRRHPDIPDSDT